jgi:PhnB protein
MSAKESGDDEARRNAVPEGYHTASVYLIVRSAAAALEFYQTAFGARLKRRLAMPDGKIMHAELQVGDSIVMLADEFPSHDGFAPEHFGGSPVSVVLYLEDADAIHAQALAAGAVSLRPMADQPFGDRSGTIRDPFGHRWILTTHIEAVSDDEIERRFATMMSGSSKEASGSSPRAT